MKTSMRFSLVLMALGASTICGFLLAWLFAFVQAVYPDLRAGALGGRLEGGPPLSPIVRYWLIFRSAWWLFTAMALLGIYTSMWIWTLLGLLFGSRQRPPVLLDHIEVTLRDRPQVMFFLYVGRCEYVKCSCTG